MAKSHVWEAEKPNTIAIKFCISGNVHDVMTHANLGEDRLRV